MSGGTPPRRRRRGNTKKKYKKERIAGKLLQHVYDCGHANCVAYAKYHCPKGPAAAEARRLAQIIDAALAEGITTAHLTMEIALRGLCGIAVAESMNNQDFLYQLECDPPGEGLPKDLLHTVLRQAKRVAKRNI